MNEEELAERVAKYLDSGLDDLPAGTLYRLRLAREKALSQVRDDELPDVPRAAGTHVALAPPARARVRG